MFRLWLIGGRNYILASTTVGIKSNQKNAPAKKLEILDSVHVSLVSAKFIHKRKSDSDHR